MNVFLPSFFFQKMFFVNIFLKVEIRIVLCYLMASHCNPMVLNLQIPSFIEAFLRVRRWVMLYASLQFRHLQAVAQPGGLGSTTQLSQVTKKT